jgi:SIR2-like domain
MFKSKTLFVIGAGAGVEINMPLGGDLSEKIAKLLWNSGQYFAGNVNSSQIHNLFNEVARDGRFYWSDLDKAANQISEAVRVALSIDTFLDSYQHSEAHKFVGKLGIAKAILNSERASKLAPNAQRTSPFPLTGVSGTWLVNLAQLLFTGRDQREAAGVLDEVAFINFNYDRCLEVFLVRALKVYFDLGEADAQRIVRNARIYHPYGRLGSVFSGDDDFLPFADDRANPIPASERLSTFTESIADQGLLTGIQQAYAEAKTIVFLGFAFHEQNMRVLGEQADKTRPKAADNVYATTYGVSDSDAAIIRNQIGASLRGRGPRPAETYIRTFPGSCSQLFAEYWRSLTQG